MNAPVLPLLNVRLPSSKSTLPAATLDPLPSTVTVPLVPLTPMSKVVPPVERLPPPDTFVVPPPSRTSVLVVEKVEPAPVIAIVAAVNCPKVPVRTAPPPFCTVSVFPAARLSVAPLARVSCAPSSVRLSLMLKVLVAFTAMLALVPKMSVEASAVVFTVPAPIARSICCVVVGA